MTEAFSFHTDTRNFLAIAERDPLQVPDTLRKSPWSPASQVKKNRKVEPLEDYTDTPQDPSRLCPEADMWLFREDGI